MKAVFVHGVPETSDIWSSMADRLGDVAVVELGLPGFGRPLPDGFEPTMDSYAAWLRDELRRIGEPVHLVGHDWGALLSLRVLADRPGNVVSWALDTRNLDDDFEWHDLAVLWQTPQAGEEFMDSMLAMSVDERAAMLTATGAPEAGAALMAQSIDRTMTDSILSLYRSAVAIGSAWGPGIDAITGPGLVIHAADDAFGDGAASARLAERTGATIGTLDGCGHWWMLDDPAAAATMLTDFWSDLVSGV